jgi:hypothetical protein
MVPAYLLQHEDQEFTCGNGRFGVQPQKQFPHGTAPVGDSYNHYSDRMTSPPDPTPKPAPAANRTQARNPLHGKTLEAIVTELAAHYGWEELGLRIPVRCFTHDPSVGSSLKFLRKTPWAREKVEGLYLFMLREQRRGDR